MKSQLQKSVLIYSLMEILKDTHGFLVLAHDEARELAARYPKRMRRHLETMAPGVDIPWYGHETQAPGFAKARASVDAEVDRMKARSRAFTEAMREDGEAGRREQGVLGCGWPRRCSWGGSWSEVGWKGNGPLARPVLPSPRPSPAGGRGGKAYFLRPAALRSASALSVFSQEKAVAVCFLPLPSV